MKKSLVITLALVFVLGLAGTAFANPYSDVPAGHWAYKAVVDLQKAGVMEGAGGKFMGNQTLTRYEIAAITARAMAKADKADAATKATIDKLAVEFSKELNDLGVRVAKLEKNQANMKWNGDYRVRWIDKDLGDTNTQHRLRLSATSKVNDDVTAYVRIMAFDHKDLGQWAGSDIEDKKNASDMEIVDINMTWKGLLGSDSMTFGRFSQKMGQLGYYLDSTGKIDGFKGTWSLDQDLKLNVGFADFAIVNAWEAGKHPLGSLKGAEMAWAEASYNVSKDLKVSALYAAAASTDYKVVGGGAAYAIDKDWTVAADYLKITDVANKDTDNTHARLSYKGAKASEVGSWGAFYEYAKFEGSPLETGSSTNLGANIEQSTISFSTTLAKNVVFDSYYSFDRKDAATGAKAADGKTFTRAQVNFMF